MALDKRQLSKSEMHRLIHREAKQLKQDYNILIQKCPKALNFHGRFILSESEVELDRSVRDLRVYLGGHRGLTECEMTT